MKTELIERITHELAPNVIASRSEIEKKFPKRRLPADSQVMRMCPSPTGFVHIGSVYTALINEYIARQSDGVNILRVEDTDKKREVAGATELIYKAFDDFSIQFNEGANVGGDYGPYLQSERGEFYLAFALELLKNGRAYPCFATAEELETAVKEQQTKKLRPGYYGQWALWRDRSDVDIASALDAKKPFVLRFRSQGSHDKRIGFDDVLKGHMELPENDLDVPLIKSDEYHLPTYHLAHVVDDYLMGTTVVLRGEEWLPSTPLHLEIAEGLGIPQFNYAHMGLISIIDPKGGGKRKLSKRKDPEADVQFWLKAGYPVEGIKAYLLGLANSNFEDWYRTNPGKPLNDFTLTFEKLAQSRSPLLDLAKLEDYTKDVIASMPQETFEAEILNQANEDFKISLLKDQDYTHSVLSIEREGDKKRKDLAKWSDAYEQYGYFFNDLFEKDFSQRIADELSGIDAEAQKKLIDTFLNDYDHSDPQDKWFDKLKIAAKAAGFTSDNKAFKAEPQKYKGNLADAAKIIRVKLTGKNRTPDLYSIMQVMGAERIHARLK